MFKSLKTFLIRTFHRTRWYNQLHNEGYAAAYLGLKFNQNPYMAEAACPKNCPLNHLDRVNAWDDGWFKGSEEIHHSYQALD